VTAQPTFTPAAFAAKWRGVTTTEKASSQSHFIDLCRMLGEPTPHDADPTGSHYAFERRVTKAGGGEGFADVWKRDFFAWEYKGSYRDLRAAYVQLLGYKDDLGNPPLLIVSDMERIEIRTNFTGLSPVLKVITLDDLAADDPSKPLSLLRDVFTAPEEFRPRIETAQITEKAARHFAELAQALRSRGNNAEAVAPACPALRARRMTPIRKPGQETSIALLPLVWLDSGDGRRRHPAARQRCPNWRCVLPSATPCRR